jgi:transposase InsO family protein
VSFSNLCNRFGYTRQAYYKSKLAQERSVLDEAVIISAIEEIRRDKDLERVGGRKLLPMLKDIGFNIGRDQLFDILRANNMLVKIRRRRYITTDSHHCLRKYPNLIKGLSITRINRMWVSDITYIRIGADDFAYLSIITDAYSRQIVGWCLHDTLDTAGPQKALTMAIESEGITAQAKLIHHSDRGTQYCSAQYINTLKYNGIAISMTESGSPYENAIAERVNGILKREWINYEKFTNIKIARERINQIIYSYNYNRPHLSLGMLTPHKARSVKGGFKKLWKNYYKNDNFEKVECQPIVGLVNSQLITS